MPRDNAPDTSPTSKEPDTSHWTARELATLATIATTFVPGDDGVRRAGLVAQALERAADPSQVAQLRLVLRAMESSLLNVALGGGATPFSAMGPAARERYLLRWASSRLGPRRSAFTSLRTLSAFLAYGDPGEDGGNPRHAAIGYRPDRPPVTVDITPIRPLRLPFDDGPAGSPMTLDADVVVVGSGAGGGVVAAELARAGRSVVILEAGPFVDERSMPTDEMDAFSRLYLNHGLLATWDASLTMLAGSGVGGGTLVNWMTTIGAPAAIINAINDAIEALVAENPPKTLSDKVIAHMDKLEDRLKYRSEAAVRKVYAKAIPDGRAQGKPQMIREMLAADKRAILSGAKNWPAWAALKGDVQVQHADQPFACDAQKVTEMVIGKNERAIGRPTANEFGLVFHDGMVELFAPAQRGFGLFGERRGGCLARMVRLIEQVVLIVFVRLRRGLIAVRRGSERRKQAGSSGERHLGRLAEGGHLGGRVVIVGQHRDRARRRQITRNDNRRNTCGRHAFLQCRHPIALLAQPRGGHRLGLHPPIQPLLMMTELQTAAADDLVPISHPVACMQIRIGDPHATQITEVDIHSPS